MLTIVFSCCKGLIPRGGAPVAGGHFNPAFMQGTVNVNIPDGPRKRPRVDN